MNLKTATPIAEIERCSSPSEIIDALLKSLNVHPDFARRYTVSEANLKARLVRRDGNPITDAALAEISFSGFHPCLMGDNPSTDALGVALHTGQPQLVATALRNGADYSYIPEFGHTGMQLAAMSTRVDWKACVAELQAAGAPIDDLPGEEPPIIMACLLSGLNLHATAGDDEYIKGKIDGLLELGADVNARTFTDFEPGWTALHRCTEKARLDLVSHLLSHGADVSAKDDDGRAPVDIAMSNLDRYHAAAKVSTQQILQLLRA